MSRIFGALSLAAVLTLATCTSKDAPDATRIEGVSETKAVDIREVAESIVLCQTADSSLLRRLGRPSRDGILHGESVMSWISSDASLTRYLAVLLDSTGTVVDLYWDIPTEVPWIPRNQCGG